METFPVIYILLYIILVEMFVKCSSKFNKFKPGRGPGPRAWARGPSQPPPAGGLPPPPGPKTRAQASARL